MEHEGIKYRTWVDRSMSGAPVYRFGVHEKPGFAGWVNSEPFVSEAAAGRAARAFIDGHAAAIREQFAPRRRRRPAHGLRIIRGLRMIISLATVEIENGGEGAFSPRQGAEASVEDDVEAALQYLRKFCKWAEQ